MQLVITDALSPATIMVPCGFAVAGRKHHPVSPMQRPARALGRHPHQLRQQPRQPHWWPHLESLQVKQVKQKLHKALVPETIGTLQVHRKPVPEQRQRSPLRIRGGSLSALSTYLHSYG